MGSGKEIVIFQSPNKFPLSLFSHKVHSITVMCYTDKYIVSMHMPHTAISKIKFCGSV